ncbi:MAG: hypothetical protein OFPII_33870 [Osedax symbiont Rs1]|nr:MAG: hypothetical protein OFPII_33870 [Osedax symbiont Rs1]
MNFIQRLWLGTWDSLVNFFKLTKFLKVIVLLIIGYVLISTGLAVYWSNTPQRLDFSATATTAPAASETAITGVATVDALIYITETLLNKPGGYLSNDKTLPGVWMDNMPRWEFGVLVQTRDMARAMRKDFSRSQSQSTEDVDLAEAEPRLHFNSDSWLFPSSEGEYSKAVEYLKSYRQRLADSSIQDAQFYARADNLNAWLSDVSTRLGSLSQKLSASVGQRRINTDLAGDAEASQSTSSSKELEVKTPWSKVDDVFYEARGSAWALVHLLKAIDQDFASVLEKKNARISLLQIIRELEATQEFVWSPFVLNGSEFGLWANHSLVMSSYITRANAAIIDLRALLSQG